MTPARFQFSSGSLHTPLELSSERIMTPVEYTTYYNSIKEKTRLLNATPSRKQTINKREKEQKHDNKKSDQRPVSQEQSTPSGKRQDTKDTPRAITSPALNPTCLTCGIKKRDHPKSICPEIKDFLSSMWADKYHAHYSRIEVWNLELENRIKQMESNSTSIDYREKFEEMMQRNRELEERMTKLEANHDPQSTEPNYKKMHHDMLQMNRILEERIGTLEAKLGLQKENMKDELARIKTNSIDQAIEQRLRSLVKIRHKRPLHIRISGFKDVNEINDEQAVELIHEHLHIKTSVSDASVVKENEGSFVLITVSDLAEKNRILQASARIKPKYTDSQNRTHHIYFGHDLNHSQILWNYAARKKAKEYPKGIAITIDKWKCKMWVAGTEIVVNHINSTTKQP
jgi:hypothetical protein